jgi:hypothetical protein
VASSTAVAVGGSVTAGGAGGVSIVPPHPARGVPSRTCASPMAGTGVPLLVLAFMGNNFTAYGGCGPCFSLSYSDLVHPYCDICFLGLTDFLPQELGLVIKIFLKLLFF